MTWMKRAALAAMVVLPLSALAFGPAEPHGPSADAIALHLADRLDLPEELAAELAARMVASREEGEVLKERARAEAEMLGSALEAGDEKAMKAAMKELERIQKEGQHLEADLADDLRAMLTVEQQARMALLHLEKMERKGEMMRRMKQRAELERGR